MPVPWETDMWSLNVPFLATNGPEKCHHIKSGQSKLLQEKCLASTLCTLCQGKTKSDTAESNLQLLFPQLRLPDSCGCVWSGGRTHLRLSGRPVINTTTEGLWKQQPVRNGQAKSVGEIPSQLLELKTTTSSTILYFFKFLQHFIARVRTVPSNQNAEFKCRIFEFCTLIGSHGQCSCNWKLHELHVNTSVFDIMCFTWTGKHAVVLKS